MGKLSDLLSECDAGPDQRPGEQHTVLHVHVIVGRAVDQQQVLVSEALGPAGEVGLLVASVVAARSRRPHVPLCVGRVCEERTRPGQLRSLADHSARTVELG